MIEPGLSDHKTETERRIEKYCQSVEELLNNINEKCCTKKKIKNTFDEDTAFIDYDETLL